MTRKEQLGCLHHYLSKNLQSLDSIACPRWCALRRGMLVEDFVNEAIATQVHSCPPKPRACVFTIALG